MSEKLSLRAVGLAGGLTVAALAPVTSKNVPFCNSDVIKGAYLVDDLCDEFRLYVDACAGVGGTPSREQIERGMEVVADSISRQVKGKAVISLGCEDGEVLGGIRYYETWDRWDNVAGVGPEILHSSDKL